MEKYIEKFESYPHVPERGCRRVGYAVKLNVTDYAMIAEPA